MSTIPRETSSCGTSRHPAPAPTSDEELACRAQGGCAASFDQLLRRFQTPVLQFLRHRGLGADAEDVTQETFLRAYENLHRYSRRWAFSAWLFTIARRTSINHRRRLRPGTNEAAAVDAARSADAEPLEALVTQESRQGLWDLATRVLSEEQTTALWLLYVEDMPVRSIASVLGRSRASVKIMLFRARRKLLPLVDAFDDEGRQGPKPHKESQRRRPHAAEMEVPYV
jgi:RNA polymerase sigma-70 factor (ECF subfamily)